MSSASGDTKDEPLDVAATERNSSNLLKSDINYKEKEIGSGDGPFISTAPEKDSNIQRWFDSSLSHSANIAEKNPNPSDFVNDATTPCNAANVSEA